MILVKKNLFKVKIILICKIQKNWKKILSNTTRVFTILVVKMNKNKNKILIQINNNQTKTNKHKKFYQNLNQTMII